jgi:hypothetical protein
MDTQNQIRNKPPIPFKSSSTNQMINNLRKSILNKQKHIDSDFLKSQANEFCFNNNNENNNAENLEATVESINFNETDLKNLETDFTFEDEDDDDDEKADQNDEDKENQTANRMKILQNYSPKPKLNFLREHNANSSINSIKSFNNKYLSTSNYSSKTEFTNVTSNLDFDKSLANNTQNTLSQSDQTKLFENTKSNDNFLVSEFFFNNC